MHNFDLKSTFLIWTFYNFDEVLRKWVISSSHSAALLVPTAFLSGRPAWFLRQELDQVLSQWLIWVGTRTSSIHWGDFNPFEIQIKWNFKLRLSWLRQPPYRPFGISRSLSFEFYFWVRSVVLPNNLTAQKNSFEPNFDTFRPNSSSFGS